MVAVSVRLGRAVRLIFIGHFFSQMLPSSIGGDAVRVWMVSREGVPLARAFLSVACDRGLAMVVLVVIVATTLTAGHALYPTVLPAIGVAHIAMIVIVAGGLLLLYSHGEYIAGTLQRVRFLRGLGAITHDMRTVLFSGSRSIAALISCVAVQILLVFAVYAFARGFAVDLRLSDAFVVVPTILLLSSLPISFAGWGVRETVMVIGLGFIGVSAVDALAVSVSFGLGQLVVGLPGAIIWLFDRRDRRMLDSMRQPLPGRASVASGGTT